MDEEYLRLGESVSSYGVCDRCMGSNRGTRMERMEEEYWIGG